MYFMPRIYMKGIKRIFILIFVIWKSVLHFLKLCGLAVNVHVHWIQTNYGLCEELLLIVLKISAFYFH